MNNQTFDSKSVLALVLASACWGVATSISKMSLASLPPLTLLVIQLGSSVAFLWIVIAITRVRISAASKWARPGLLGLLNPGLSYALSLLGLITVSASTSSLLWAAEPAFILVLAWPLLRERPSAGLVVLTALALVGVALVSGLFSQADPTGAHVGSVLILSGVVCCAFYTVLSRRLDPALPAVFVIALQQTVALIFACVLLPFQPFIASPVTSFAIPASGWLWAIASGLLYYALAFWFYLRGLRRVTASTAGIFLNLIPVFGIAGAYLLLGERLSLAQWLGAAMIVTCVSGAWLWQKVESKRERARTCVTVTQITTSSKIQR
jgi:drug/metabolite transporter (DMT)-like permease